MICNLFVVPSEPQQLETVSDSVTSTSVTLQWMQPEYPNGIITQYSIEYDGKVIDKFGGDVSDRMTSTVEGLTPDTDYVFKMKAYTVRGGGPPVSLHLKTSKLLNIVMHTFSQPLKTIYACNYIMIHIVHMVM